MTKRAYLLAIATAATLLAGGGVAVAGEGDEQTKAARCEQVLERIAAKRGVSVEELKAKRSAHALERVDAALAAGRISAERAAEIRARVEAGTAGCGRLLGRVKARLRAGAHRLALRAAAEYLGTTAAELAARRRSGQSIAQIAEASGKSVAGLEEALVAAFEDRLERAVGLTEEQRAKLLARFEERVERFIDAVPEAKAS
jgi:hypothetical protein